MTGIDHLHTCGLFDYDLEILTITRLADFVPDFHHLLASLAVFARSFDPNRDSAIFDVLDTSLAQRTRGEYAVTCECA